MGALGSGKEACARTGVAGSREGAVSYHLPGVKIQPSALPGGGGGVVVTAPMHAPWVVNGGETAMMGCVVLPCVFCVCRVMCACACVRVCVHIVSCAKQRQRVKLLAHLYVVLVSHSPQNMNNREGFKMKKMAGSKEAS